MKIRQLLEDNVRYADDEIEELANDPSGFSGLLTILKVYKGATFDHSSDYDNECKVAIFTDVPASITEAQRDHIFATAFPDPNEREYALECWFQLERAYEDLKKDREYFMIDGDFHAMTFSEWIDHAREGFASMDDGSGDFGDDE